MIAPRLLAVASIVLLFSACSRKPALPAAEVLQRSAVASQTLESATYALRASVTSSAQGMRFTVHGTSEGILQAKGQDSEHHLVVTVDADQAGQAMGATIEGDLSVDWNRKLFFFLKKLEITPAAPTGSEAMASLLNRWWSFPLAEEEPAAPQITADPGLLQLQASAMKVVKEYPVESLRGEDVYHYDVTLDPDALKKYLKTAAEERKEPFDAEQVDAFIKNFRADGSVKIFASSFFPAEFQWHLTGVPGNGEQSDLDATVTFTLSDHNAAPTIAFPQTSEPFSPELLLGLVGMASAMPGAR